MTPRDDETDVVPVGCKFVRRCPHAMPMCREQEPPVFRTDERRGVACYLWKDSPAMSSGEASDLVLPAPRPPAAKHLSAVAMTR